MIRDVNKATFTGGEASFKWQQDELFLSTTYAYVQAKDDETKKDIRGFWWEQVIKLTKKRKKVLKQEHKDRKEVLDYLT